MSRVFTEWEEHTFLFRKIKEIDEWFFFGVEKAGKCSKTNEYILTW